MAGKSFVLMILENSSYVPLEKSEIHSDKHQLKVQNSRTCDARINVSMLPGLQCWVPRQFANRKCEWNIDHAPGLALCIQFYGVAINRS